MMCVRELVEEAGGKYTEDGGLFSELFSFEAFLNTLPEKKRKAARAIVELYKRSLTDKEVKTVRDSIDIYNMMRALTQGLDHEEFWMITLNNAQKVISRRRISSGGIDQTTADIRMMMRYALQDSATQIVVVHNHPSGNITPSKADISLTQRISKAADIMNIRLLDHVVVTDGNYYSFHENGMN